MSPCMNADSTGALSATSIPSRFFGLGSDAAPDPENDRGKKKLSNARFVDNAPEQVVASEKKKEADALAKIETLKASLKSLT